MHRPFAVLIGLVSAFVIAGSALAEDLVGTVADRAGQAVQGAKVIAHSSDGQATQSASTDANGQYHMSGLNPGQYFITLEASGFGGPGQTVASYVGNSGLTVNWSVAPGTSPIAAAQPGIQLSSASSASAAAITSSSSPPPGCPPGSTQPPCGPKKSKKLSGD